MDKPCEHDWIFKPASCCDKSLTCTVCDKRTRAYALGADVRSGDRVTVSDETGIAHRRR
jgi:hypothetical protein